MTAPFPRLGGVLHSGGISLESLADRFGTPLYVYDLDQVRESLRRFEGAFAGMDLLLAYSVKANGNLAVLHRMAQWGAGADIVSGGELFRARQAGIPADRIVFAGVAKTAEEMRAGLREGIYAFNVESQGELRRLEAVAAEEGTVAPFAMRVNPDIVSPTPHEYTRTGHAQTKFGVPMGRALDLYREAARSSHLWARGIDVHIGSQILDAGPFVQALDHVATLARSLRSEGVLLEFLDLGGGYGVRYGEAGSERALDLEELAERMRPTVAELELRLVLEPGRSLVGPAGVLLTRVEYVKEGQGKTFVIVDGGMTELLRPSHYGGYHAIEPVRARPGAEARPVDVVGPICETGDFLARDRPLPLPRAGDLLAVHTAGAYGFAMASNYNARRRPAEVVVEGGEAFLVRERESLEDLVRGERIPWPVG